VLDESARERVGVRMRAAPDADALDRTRVAMRVDQPARLATGADHQQVPRVLAGEEARGVRGRARGAPRSDLLAVQQRERLAARRVEQRVDGADRALAAVAVAGEHRHQLDADPLARPPRRHQQQRGGGRSRRVDRVVRAQRRGDVVAQHRRERFVHPRPRQPCADRGGIEIAHDLVPAQRSSGSDSNAALPPAAAVLTVTVRSTTRRAGS
jgi:hypothetical protein